MFILNNSKRKGGSSYTPIPDREKPVNPTLDWNNPYLQSITPEASGIYWYEATGRPKELIRNEESVEASSMSLTPEVYSGIACGYAPNFVNKRSLFPRLPSPVADGKFTIICLTSVRNWDASEYSHFFTDGNMWTNGTNYAFLHRSDVLFLYTNRGGLAGAGSVGGAPQSDDNQWVILAVTIDRSLPIESCRMYKRFDYIVGTPNASKIFAGDNPVNPWDGSGGNANYVAVGDVANASSGRSLDDRMAWVYYFNRGMGDQEMLDLLNNPYQIFL